MPPRKRWIKQWTQESLTGFPRFLEPDERSVWYDLRSLAGDSCNPGVICAYPGVPYTDEQICRILHISLKLFMRAKAKMMAAGDISMNGDGSIIVSEWEHLQSEYDRQKPYRVSKGVGGNPGVTPEVTPEVTEEVTPEVTEEVQQKATPRTDQTRGEHTRTEVDTPPAGGAHQQRGTPDPRVKQILDEIKSHLGFPDRVDKDPIPNYPKEGQFIKKMLTRRFTPEQVLEYWKKRIDAAGGDFITAAWINDDIGKRGRSRTLPTAEELAASWGKGA